MSAISANAFRIDIGIDHSIACNTIRSHHRDRLIRWVVAVAPVCKLAFFVRQSTQFLNWTTSPETRVFARETFPRKYLASFLFQLLYKMGEYSCV